MPDTRLAAISGRAAAVATMAAAEALAGRLEGEPGEGDHGDAVAHARDEGGRLEQQEGSALGTSPIQGGRSARLFPS